MAVIDELSIKLALESGNFSKQMSTINKEIKNTEKDFKSAGKGIKDFEQSFTGIDAKIQKTSKQLDLYNVKLDKQKEKQEKLSNVLEKQKSKLSEIENELGKGSKEWEKQAQLVQKNAQKLSNLSSDINATQSNISKLTSELKQSQTAFEQLGNKAKTLEEKLQGISSKAELTESEFNRLGTELNQSGTYFAKLGNEIQRLGSQIEQNENKISVYESEISKLNTELTQNKQKHTQLAQSIQQTENELQQAQNEFGQTSTQAQQLNTRLNSLRDEFNSVENEIQQGSSALNRYQSELNNTQADINRLTSQMQRLPFDRIGQSLTSAGSTIKGVGQDLTSYVTLPLAGATLGIGKMAYDFDQGLAKVGSLVDKSGKEMKAYEDTIKGLSNETGVSLGQMTESMYQGISAGADLNNIFSLLDTSSKLSIGGFTSQETAIDGLTTAMNSFGLSYDDVNSVADKFILTQNKGKTTVDELASTIGQVAPTANAAGVSLDELLSATASLTMNGVRTSESMTAMKAALSNVIKPSSQAQKMAESLGLEFNSTALQSKGLAGFLEDVKQKTGGNVDTMAQLFGSTEALNAILLLTGEGADEFSNTLASMGDSAGLAEDAFKNMKDSAGAELLDSINSLKNSLVEMGDVLAPVIQWLADQISKLSGWFNGLDDSGKKTTMVMAGLAMTIGPVLSGIGSILMIGGNLTMMFGGIAGSGGGLASVLGGLSGLALPALALALAGLMSALGENESALASLQDKFGVLGTVIGGVCETVAGATQLTFGNMLILIQGAMQGIGALLKGEFWKIDDIASTTWAKVENNTARAMSNMLGESTQALSALRNMTQSQLSGVEKTFDLAMSKLPETTAKNTNEVAKVFADNLKNLDNDGIQILRGTSDNMAVLFEGINTSMDNKSATDKFKANLESMVKAGSLDGIEQDITKAMELINNSISDGSAQVKQSATDMFNTIKDSSRTGMDGAVANVVGQLGTMNAETLSQLSSMGSTWKSVFSGITLDGSMSSAQMKDVVLSNIKNLESQGVDIIGALRSESSQHWKGLEEDANSSINNIDNKEATVKVDANVEDSKQKLDDVSTKADELNNKGTTTIKADADTTQASSNINNLKQDVESFPSDTKTTNFHTETAGASKNVTGLKTNLSDYDKKHTNKTKKTTFQAITATASKNVTGLKNNISNFVSRFCKTFTTTFKVVTSYSTQGSPTPQSSGTKAKPQGKSVKPMMINAEPRSIQPMAINNDNPNQMTISAIPRVAQPTRDVSALLKGASSYNSSLTTDTPIAIGGADIADGLEYNIDLLKELEEQLKLVTNQIDLLNKKSEHATSQEKISYLKQQNDLYKEQQQLLKRQEDYLQRQKNYYKYSLENRGIKFNSDDNMTNYEELLLKKEKELKVLEEKANRDKASDWDKKSYDNAKSSLDDLKKYADEYYKVAFDELPKVKSEWEDLNNTVIENANSIKELERTQKLYTKNTKLKEILEFQDELADKQDIINENMKNASGEEQVKYYKDLIGLSETYQKHQELKIKTYKESLAILQEELKQFGLTFDPNDSMENIDEVLNKFQNSKDLEYLNELMEEYFDIQREKLPNAQKEWEKVKNEIKGSQDAIKDFNKEVEQLKYDVAFTSIKKHVDELNNQLEILDVRLENAFGQNKNELLQEKVDLLHKQKQEMKDVVDYLKKAQNDLKGKLVNKGFNVDDKGNIRNYDSHMAKLKETLSKDDFDEVEKLTKSYLDLLVKEVPQAEKEWEDLNNEIREHQNELEKIQRQLKLDIYINKLKELENEYDKFSDKLDIIDAKLKHAHGQEKIDLLEDQMKLLEQQKKKQEEMANQYKSMMKIYQSDLSEFGIKFDNEGDISNLDEILNKYQSHQDIEKLKNLVDEYLDIQRDKLPDVEKGWEDLNNAIKDACKEQLEVIKDIEDEITKVYKKQVQDRIDLINKELDSRIKALDKEKKAYDDARKEADYKRDYEDQKQIVEDLQAKLETAKKDTSLPGQKKVQELLKQLKEEQRKLEDLVQGKLDDQISDMFDKESNRLEDSAKDTIEDLEDKFSDSKIAELVAQALGGGVFTDIEGNVSSLEDVLVDFAHETGDLFGVLGATIENELIDKLKQSIDIFKDLDEIYNNLGVNSRSKFYIPNVDYKSSRYAPSSNNNVTNNTNNSKVEVQFNSPFMVIEGNVTEDIMPKVEKMVKKAQENVVKNINKRVR